MRKNRIWKLFGILTICAGLISGCGVSSGANLNMGADDKINIVCTAYPQYDWVKEIIGDKADNYELTFLLDKGMDPHNYQPAAEDIVKIGDCDVFIYVGGISDQWVEDALKEARNTEQKVINLMNILGEKVKIEEIVEGMEEEHEHAHDEAGHNEAEHDEAAHDEVDHDEADHDQAEHDEADHDEVKHDEAEHDEAEHNEADHDEVVHDEKDHDETDHDETTHDETAHDEAGHNEEYDEHIWLSLKNAQVLVEAISQVIETVDESNAEAYKENTANYITKLKELDAEYETAVEAAARKTVLFCDRFPFRYLTDDYGLTYYAAFPGCSAETEASFETITFLAQKTEELQLPAVLIIENSDEEMARTIINSTQDKGQQILVMNSLQSVNTTDIENGFSYLKAMKENLDILKQALN